VSGRTVVERSPLSFAPQLQRAYATSRSTDRRLVLVRICWPDRLAEIIHEPCKPLALVGSRLGSSVHVARATADERARIELAAPAT